jgi:hypothetical protein
LLARPHRCREPLPRHAPKPADEDPDAPRRVQAILDGPTCRSADRDLFWYVDSAEEIRRGILEWHEANGTPLFSGRSARVPGPVGS